MNTLNLERWLIACAIFAVASGGVCAQAGSERGTQGTVVVQTIAEEVVRGELTSLSVGRGLALRTTGGKALEIPMAEVVRIRTGVRPVAGPPRDARLTLIGGDWLRGKLMDSNADTVIMKTIDLGMITLPLDTVLRLDTEHAAQPAFREAVAWLDRERDASDDRALLTNGDTVHGFITAMGREAVEIDGSLGPTSVPRRLVVAVRLASPDPPDIENLHYVVTFRTSGTLTCTGLIWDGDLVKLDTRHGLRTEVDARNILSVEVRGGRWEWLSGHTPISFEHTPLVSLAWPYQVNRNVRGGPLLVQGQLFSHGLGVHSRSHLTYALKGEYQTFITSAGMDDDSGPLADVSVRILVDGAVRFEQQQVRAAMMLGPIRLDVKGANHLELVVDFGANGDLEDRFNWIEPALIR